VKNSLNLPMHTARIPPVDPAPATIAAVAAMHAGHISRSLLGDAQVQILMQISIDQGVTSVAGFFDVNGYPAREVAEPKWLLYGWSGCNH
jgi:hypothetical protein